MDETDRPGAPAPLPAPSPIRRWICRKAIPAVLALLAAPAAASAQYVKDFVDVEGARANKIHGYGVVTGLNGNGDSPKDESSRHLRNLLQNLLPPEVIVQNIQSRNAALVIVRGELAPFQKKGTRLDLTVSAIGDAKSLYGGELQLTSLHGPLGAQDRIIYALASGRVVIQGDARRGNPTSGAVPGGAIVEEELPHRFITDEPLTEDGREVRRKVFRLVLKRPDLSLASQLAAQINAQAVAGEKGRLDRLASALDGGWVRVYVPTSEEYQRITGSPPEVDYEAQPARWVDRVLNLPLTLAATDQALITINDATKTVSWTGEVKLREGSVLVAIQNQRPSVFRAREGQRLSDFMSDTAGSLTEQQLIDVVRALHAAGLVKAELRSQ